MGCFHEKEPLKCVSISRSSSVMSSSPSRTQAPALFTRISMCPHLLIVLLMTSCTSSRLRMKEKYISLYHCKAKYTFLYRNKNSRPVYPERLFFTCEFRPFLLCKKQYHYKLTSIPQICAQRISGRSAAGQELQYRRYLDISPQALYLTPQPFRLRESIPVPAGGERRGMWRLLPDK